MHGMNYIGLEKSGQGKSTYQAVNPATGQLLPGAFHEATPAEIEKACAQAAAAFQKYRLLPGKKRAEFLEAVAEAILAREAALKERLMAETAYPEARAIGERDRIVG